MVTLLKRNHDILMEKYEIFRGRNETLEKVALEKEKLYNQMKIEFDNASQARFILEKKFEEVRNVKDILEVRLKKLEDSTRSKDENLKTLKF
mmetsp:Transcript_19418/g.29834  ORF Transcript_19418/g.29834 Transcript_19418/m.29834 type:complete len:92 (+) Transcript_19418:522-797(+)